MDWLKDASPGTPAQTSGITMSAEHREQMKAHIEAMTPEEACGLVAGRNNQVIEVYCAANALRSPVRYRMNPQEQWQIFQQIEARGLALLAIYHSHPAGPAMPSATDIAEAAYPGIAHLIWSWNGEEWVCRGFFIDNGQVEEIPVHLMPRE
jgi:[CysO sulfur-carrier protein]-S-L-cysteine hydrolase